MAGTIKINQRSINITEPNYLDEITQSLKKFCQWLTRHYSCVIEDEFGNPVDLKKYLNSFFLSAAVH